MNPELLVRRAAVHVLPIYTCVSCKARARGSTAELTFVGVTDLNQAVASGYVSARHMPQGWASFLEGHKCPNCFTSGAP